MNLRRFIMYLLITWLIGLSIFLMNQNGILIDSLIIAINTTEGVSITLGDILSFIVAVFMIIATIDCVVFDR